MVWPGPHDLDPRPTHVHRSTAGRSAEEAARYTRALVAACVVEPRIWLGQDEQCPEDQITPDDFEQRDLDYLVSEIVAFNGFTQEAAQRADSFREGQRGAAGQDRPQVSGAPDGAPQLTPWELTLLFAIYRKGVMVQRYRLGEIANDLADKKALTLADPAQTDRLS